MGGGAVSGRATARAPIYCAPMDSLNNLDDF